MRNPGGQLTGFHEDGRVQSRDTFTCSHCNSVRVLSVGQRPEDLGGFCRMCGRLICEQEACHTRCEPFEKKLETIERRDETLRSLGLECR